MNRTKVLAALEKKCVATALVGLGYTDSEMHAEKIAVRMNRPECGQLLAEWWLTVEELMSVHHDMCVEITTICLVP
jgi:hypothetical protein